MINFMFFGFFWPVSTTPGKNVIAGVKDTADKFLLVSTTPADKFSPIIYYNDDKGLFFLQIGTNQWYLRPPKSDAAADGIIGTTMKSCIHRHLAHLYKRPLRPPKLNIPLGFEVVSAASGASYIDVQGAYGCNFSWWFQWYHRRPRPTSAAGSNETNSGRRYQWFVPFNILPSMAAPHLHGVLVLVTGNKFIAGVVVTGDNCTLVSFCHHQ
jgi:hypothetical protein